MKTSHRVLLWVMAAMLLLPMLGCRSFFGRKETQPSTVEEMLSQPRPGDHLRMGK